VVVKRGWLLLDKAFNRSRRCLTELEGAEVFGTGILDFSSPLGSVNRFSCEYIQHKQINSLLDGICIMSRKCNEKNLPVFSFAFFLLSPFSEMESCCIPSKISLYSRLCSGFFSFRLSIAWPPVVSAWTMLCSPRDTKSWNFWLVLPISLFCRISLIVTPCYNHIANKKAVLL